MIAQELRLGNLVTDIHASDVSAFEVTKITETHCYYGAAFKLKWEGIKPVPLTEEWLIKFGFYKDRTDWILQPHPNSIPYMRINQFSDRLFTCDKTGTIFKTVHHLQNYFHALYLKELTPLNP